MFIRDLTVWRGRVRRLSTGAEPTLGLTFVLALVLVVLPLAHEPMADVPLVLFMVPIGLCAVRFGVKGGLGAATLGALLAVFWFLDGQLFGGGLPDLLTQMLVFFLVGGLVGKVIDQRRELERETLEHQELSLDLICTASPDGFFTRVNPAGQRLLGYRPDELLARPFLDFVHPDDRAMTVAELRRQTEEGLPVFNFRNRYRHKDGSYLWLEWSSRPDQQRKRLMAVARDVSERVAAEQVVATYREQLEQAVLDRTAGLEEARLETLGRLALAAEFRDDSTFEHIERVAQTSTLLAQTLGLPEHEVELIGLAAPLHDVGKLGVSDQLLLKPGKLTAAEYERMKEHTTDGAAILANSNSDVLQLAEQIALSHHEWWNGNGYPHGLEGDQIPLPARIVAVADVFDALTHRRPYKHAWPVERAIAEIRRLSGSQFDPRVVDAFNKLNPQTLTAAKPHRLHEPNRPQSATASLAAVEALARPVTGRRTATSG
jgi:PAS domain S-box-containing protein